MDLKAVITFLEEEGYGDIGKDLFRNFMPAEVEKGLLVLPSQLPIEIDDYAPDKRMGAFRVVARGNDYDSPQDLLTEVSNVLRGEGQQLGDMCFYYILPAHEPLLYPKSDSGLVEASVSFNCCYVLT